MRRNHQDRIKNFPLFIENIVEISTFFCYYNRIAGSVSQTRRQNEGGRVMEIDIANNIKAVELLKVEILQNVTDLFGDISAEADKETREDLTEDTARLITKIYLLCSRLGLDYDDITDDMKAMLKEGIGSGHILERRFGDLSALLGCLAEEREVYEK